jgi:hypothetical protein
LGRRKGDLIEAFLSEDTRWRRAGWMTGFLRRRGMGEGCGRLEEGVVVV